MCRANIMVFYLIFHSGQHSFCSTCLPKLLTTASSNNSRYYDYYVYRNTKDYIDCPICRTKHFTKVDDIPKSRLILNLIELAQGNQNSISDLLASLQTQSKKSIKEIESKPLDTTTTSSIPSTPSTPSTTTTPRLTNKSNHSSYITPYSPPNYYDRQTSAPVNNSSRPQTAIRQQSTPTQYVSVQTQNYRTHSRQQSPVRMQHFEQPSRTTSQQNHHQSPTTYYHLYQPQQAPAGYVRFNNATSSNSSANLRQIRIQECSPSRPIRNDHCITPVISTSTPRCNINRSQSLYSRSHDSHGIQIANSKRYANTNNINHNTPE
jgi:hypothetical protein